MPPTRYSASTARPSCTPSYPASPEAKQAQALGAPGEIGEEMDADLVAEQRLHPAPRHHRAARDQQPRPGHDHPRGQVAPQLDARREPRQRAAVSGDHPARFDRQLLAIDAAFPAAVADERAAWWVPAQHHTSRDEQLGFHRAVEHPGQIAELRLSAESQQARAAGRTRAAWPGRGRGAAGPRGSGSGSRTAGASRRQPSASAGDRGTAARAGTRRS